MHNLGVQLSRTFPDSQHGGKPTLPRSTGFRIGLFLLFLAALSVLGLMLTTAREQALTPGEKNLGVAALFMFWSLPVMFFGAGGVCFLVVSTTIFLYRKFGRQGSPTPRSEC
jgi:hypothetical protein